MVGVKRIPLPPEKLTPWFENIGMLYPDIIASLVSLGEIGAGIGIIIGGLFKRKYWCIYYKIVCFFYICNNDWRLLSCTF